MQFLENLTQFSKQVQRLDFFFQILRCLSPGIAIKGQWFDANLDGRENTGAPSIILTKASSLI